MSSSGKYKLNTELSSLISTEHGRERRLERHIDKNDLQRAKKYGMKEKAIKGREKYTLRLSIHLRPEKKV